MLFGEGDEVTGWAEAANVADEPERRFEVDPAALFAALRAERAGGPRVAGYWHSHPGGDARPSPTDLALAAPDGRLWIIAAANRLTAWRATPGGFEPVSLAEAA